MTPIEGAFDYIIVGTVGCVLANRPTDDRRANDVGQHGFGGSVEAARAPGSEQFSPPQGLASAAVAD